MSRRNLTLRTLDAVPANHPMRQRVVHVPLLLVLAIPVVTGNLHLVPGLLAVYAALAVIWWPVRPVPRADGWERPPGVLPASWSNVLGEDLPPMPVARVRDVPALEWDVDVVTGEVLDGYLTEGRTVKQLEAGR